MLFGCVQLVSSTAASRHQAVCRWLDPGLLDPAMIYVLRPTAGTPAAEAWAGRMVEWFRIPPFSTIWSIWAAS